MSAGRRYHHVEAWHHANDIKNLLAPYCERIEIAGSLRRQKPTVGDIELLYIPKQGVRQLDLLASESYSLADEQINDLLRREILAQRPNVNGGFTWGKLNKLAVHVPSGIPVDLFATTPANWFVSLVVRTGGKETNLELTTGAQAKGRSLLAYGCGVRCSDGTIIPATSEEHVFELCGAPYQQPTERR